MTHPPTTFISHLQELRSRLIRASIALATSMVLGLIFAKPIYRFLQIPLLKVLPDSSKFITTTPLEAMITYFKVAFLAGFFISLPYLFYQLWGFIAPGLYKNEKQATLLFVFSSTLFFVGGAFFGYFIVFPLAFRFFIQLLTGTEIQFLPQMKEYLNFSIQMILAFGLTFEMPLFIYFLAYLGLVTYEDLKKTRRYAIVIIFIVAAFMTPGPDVLSQILMAIPLLCLYEISLMAVWITRKKKTKSESV